MFLSYLCRVIQKRDNTRKAVGIFANLPHIVFTRKYTTVFLF